jgi:hypothetical protein
MKELVWFIIAVLIGTILLTMEIGYCIIRDTMDYIRKYIGRL